MNQKVILSAKLPRDSYFGGVATITRQYLEHTQLFKKNGIDLELFDYQLQGWPNKINNSKLREIIYIFQQRFALKKKYGKNSNEAIIHIQTSRKWTLMKDLLLAKTAKKQCNLLTLMTIHYADIDSVFYKNSLLKDIQMSLLKRYVDHIVFLSNKTQNECINKGYPQNRCSVEYTFHNFKISNEMRPLRVDNELNLLFVGSLDSRKGILDLLYTLKGLGRVDWKLTVCGTFTEKKTQIAYEKIVNELGDKVLFMGYVSGGKKKKVFCDADILILPSYGEGMPIVIMEAMASGCAVISTKVGAIPEVINRESGILITPGDRVQLGNAIMEYANDRKKLKETQEYNKCYAENFYISEHISRLCAIYQKVINSLGRD